MKNVNWNVNATFVENECGGFVNREEEFYICPECGEPVYKADWQNDELEEFICPICELRKEDLAQRQGLFFYENFFKKCLTKDPLYGKMSARPWSSCAEFFLCQPHMQFFWLKTGPDLALRNPEKRGAYGLTSSGSWVKILAPRAWLGPRETLLEASGNGGGMWQQDQVNIFPKQEKRRISTREKEKAGIEML